MSDNLGASTVNTLASTDRDRVKAQVRRWQDRVLDLTRSNPLIGLNRARVSKLSIVAPGATALFESFILNETPLRMPLVRRRSRRPPQMEVIERDAAEEVVVEAGDVTFDALSVDLMRRLRRIHDNARTTVEERGVTTLYLTFGALRWTDDTFEESVSPLWMVPCEFERRG